MKGIFPSLYFLYIPASNSLYVCIFLPLISTQAFDPWKREGFVIPRRRGEGHIHGSCLITAEASETRLSTPYHTHLPTKATTILTPLFGLFQNYATTSYVCNSCHGWLILSDEDDQFSLFNPVTLDLESILLPPHDKLDPKTHINACALSSPPADPSCALYLFDSGLRRILCCRLENQVWFEKSYGKVIEAVAESSARRKNYLHSPVSCNGKLYATTYYGGQLVSIDTTEQSTSDLFIRPLGTSLPSGNEPLSQWVQLVLVESGGELFTIVTMGGGRLLRQVVGIQIFKLDWTSVTWERVDNAKDRAFFLCNRYAISCTHPDQVRGNCVYFLGYNDRDLCMYDIANGSISLLLPCLNLSTPRKSPFWVMPDLRLPNLNIEADHGITGNKEQKEEEEEADEKDEESEEGAETEEDEKIEAKEGLDRRHHPLSSPWLMNFEKNNGVCSFVEPSRGDRYLVRIPKSLQDSILCHCNDGWLLLCQRLPATDFSEEGFQYCLTFFNPFTKEIVTHPALLRLGLMCGLTRFGFSSVPSSSDCVVVVATFCYTRVGIYTSRSREEEWSYNVVEYAPVFQPSFSIPIFANNAFYFMGESGNLGVLRLEEGAGCDFVVLENTKTPCESFDRNFLAGCDGELLSIFVGVMGKWVQVFKLNPSTMGWERVESLGNHTLYVSALSALSAEAKTPEMEEKIFFSRFYGQGIAAYSLSTGMHHYSSGCEEGSLKDYFGTREQLSSGWIVPRWH